LKEDHFVTVRIRHTYVSTLDEIARRLGYAGRDEVVEDAVRRFVESLGLTS
jgi:metal-responsive CopG/Arc/MetJ family transcriptional regulator